MCGVTLEYYRVKINDIPKTYSYIQTLSGGRKRKRTKGRRGRQGQVQVQWVQREPAAFLSATRPSLGRLNLARQEKLQVTMLQASLTEITNVPLCLSVWVHSNLFFICQVKDKPLQDSKQSTERSFFLWHHVILWEKLWHLKIKRVILSFVGRDKKKPLSVQWLT